MQTKTALAALLASAAGLVAANGGSENLYTGTSANEIARNAAQAPTRSPTSHVPGKAFDRLVIIYLENTDYDMALSDPNLSMLARQGITLSNYHALSHPSQANYVGSVGGDYFGMNNDDFWQIDTNVTTLMDLLDERHISWGYYQEDLPFSGFEGIAYPNPVTHQNDYVRKHLPGITFNSIASNPERLALIKNMTLFYKELSSGQLPQWLFVTPNMTDDGHDTSVTTAGLWTRTFLEPLLRDPYFMNRTAILITFDENSSYAQQNCVLSILLGDAIPRQLIGTIDDTFYSHYSEISSVVANWDLHTLGRWDVGANVWRFVADYTGDALRPWTSIIPLSKYYWNYSYDGVLNSRPVNPRYPRPNLDIVDSKGRTVHPNIWKMWYKSDAPSYYDGQLSVPDGYHPPKGYAPRAPGTM